VLILVGLVEKKNVLVIFYGDRIDKMGEKKYMEYYHQEID
jgi:hypothetical protein